MIYHAYQTWSDLMQPARMFARLGAQPIGEAWPDLSGNGALARMRAAAEVFARLALTHRRPDYGITTVTIGGREIGVHEEPALRTPFGTLLHFRKDADVVQPRVLLVAPLSGHFATLLRGTVRTLLLDHDVFVTDWHNVRDVPLWHGAFGLDDYVDHLMRFMRVLGPGAHMVAVCQPTVAALAATALMAEDGDPAQPRTLTLMAGPIDTRVNPTEVNALATSRSIEWFERTLIGVVPWRHASAMRRVYPGFLQIAGFMSMNLDRHAKAFVDLFHHIVDGDTARADTIRTFYEEYFAMMDLPAEFYLETVERVFQRFDLPLGRLTWRGHPVDPAAIRRPSLLTIEGEKDDICAVGQTLAAQDLCTAVRPYRRRHHVQTGVGHYGVFNGRRWERQIYPILRNFVFFGA